MFLHHLATISLITFSYVNNMARVGTLVMCVHDAADVLMEVSRGRGSEHFLFFSRCVLSLLLCWCREAVPYVGCVWFVFRRQLRWPTTPSAKLSATCCLPCSRFCSSAPDWVFILCGEWLPLQDRSLILTRVGYRNPVPLWNRFLRDRIRTVILVPLCVVSCVDKNIFPLSLRNGRKNVTLSL